MFYVIQTKTKLSRCIRWPPSKLKIKAGQQVEVIAGNNKGLRAEVLYVDGRRLRVLVRGVNLKNPLC